MFLGTVFNPPVTEFAQLIVPYLYYEGIISNEQFDDVQKERERRNNIEFDEESIEDLYFLYDVQSRPAFVEREGGMYR